MATPVSGADGWLTINRRMLSFREHDENSALNIGEYSDNYIEITDQAPRYLKIFIDDELWETTRYGIWIWKAKDYAGLYQLRAEAPGHEAQTAWIRVFPHKFTQRIYEQMKTELSTIASDLLYCLISPANERAAYSKRSEETSKLLDYKQVRRIIEEMRDIMSVIRRDPHHTLRDQHIAQQWHEVRQFAENSYPQPGDAIRLPQLLGKRQAVRQLPENWLVRESNLTYDTYENRLLKYFLQKQLVTKLGAISERAAYEKKQHEMVYARYKNEDDKRAVQKLGKVIDDCQQMQQRCIRWSGETFLKVAHISMLIGKATQVLLKHPAYSRFYKLYLSFQNNRLDVNLSTDQFINELALRKVSELYEMWSVFTITKVAIDELLADGYRMVSNTTFYELEKGYFQFEVRKNFASIILAKDDLRVEIKYEPVYVNQASVINGSAIVAAIGGGNPQTPDMAIEVYRNGEIQDVLVFDAKYRWERGNDGFFYPKDEDMEKMHSYRSRIQYKRYDPGRARNPYIMENIVESAYILYPGNRISKEANDRVGGLPLRPDMSREHFEEVKEHLRYILYYAYLIN